MESIRWHILPLQRKTFKLLSIQQHTHMWVSFKNFPSWKVPLEIRSNSLCCLFYFFHYLTFIFLEWILYLGEFNYRRKNISTNFFPPLILKQNLQFLHVPIICNKPCKKILGRKRAIWINLCLKAKKGLSLLA